MHCPASDTVFTLVPVSRQLTPALSAASEATLREEFTVSELVVLLPKHYRVHPGTTTASVVDFTEVRS